MKKYLLIISAAIFSLVSCKDAEVSTPSNNNSSMAELQITADQTQTRTDGDTRYVVEAYSDSDYTTPAYIFSNNEAYSMVTTSSSVSMTIDDGADYYLLLWADDGETYAIDDLKNVTLADNFDLCAEAWQGTYDILGGSAGSTYSTTLKRAVANVKFVETDEFTGSTLAIKYNTYSTFDVSNGDTTGDATSFEHNYTFTESVTGQLNYEPIYVLAPVETADVVDFTYNIDGSAQTISNVPVQANYITTISGHYEAEDSGSFTLSFNADEDWVEDDADEDVIVIRSIDELMRYITMDNINAKMAPGTYYVTTDVATTYGREIDEYTGSVAIFVFEGDNSTYDFDGVRFEIDTDVLRALGSHDFYTFNLQGASTTLKNLEIEFIGTSYNYTGGAAIVMDGSDNTIDGFDLTTRGSYPYGYGDMFGKGSSYTIKHYKHCGILVRGDRPTLINTSVHQFSYGHAIFCQGSVDATIDNCYVESELSNTDAVLAEEGTGSAADAIDFLTDWGYRVPPGYAFSCCEEGFRAYSTGHVLGTDGSRSTTNTTVTNCSAFQVRGGYVLHFSGGTKLAENCSAIDCETGFGIGNGTMVNCEGNSNIGLLFVVPYSTNSGSEVDLKILSSTHDHIYGYHNLLAYIAGKNHIYTFTEDVNEKMDCHDNLEIMFGGERTGLRFLNTENLTETDNLTATSINLTNNTYYPIIFGENATSNTVSTKGTYIDNGSGNVVTKIE